MVTKKRTILVLFIVVWMGFIFSMSAKNGDESQAMSDGIVVKIVELVGNKMSDKPLTDETVYLLSFLVRKAAHMTEYAILGFLTVWFATDFSWTRKRAVFGSWIFSTLYAGTDEFHQLFSAGRSGQLRDVCIDSVGVLLGILAFFCICAILRAILKK